MDNDVTDGQGFLDGIAPGNYLGMIIDSVGCEANFPLILDDGIPIVIPNAPQMISAPSCAGDANASYTITASGGSTGEFDFTWSSGESDSSTDESTATALSSGEQFVIISDGICPPDTSFFMVDEGDVVTLNSTGTMIEDVECFGEASGSIQVDLSLIHI